MSLRLWQSVVFFLNKESSTNRKIGRYRIRINGPLGEEEWCSHMASEEARRGHTVYWKLCLVHWGNAGEIRCLWSFSEVFSWADWRQWVSQWTKNGINEWINFKGCAVLTKRDLKLQVFEERESPKFAHDVYLKVKETVWWVDSGQPSPIHDINILVSVGIPVWDTGYESMMLYSEWTGLVITHGGLLHQNTSEYCWGLFLQYWDKRRGNGVRWALPSGRVSPDP